MIRISKRVQIGNIAIGGGNPVAIQAMTDTDTADVATTVEQILELAAAGAEIVRVTVNNEYAAKAVPKIKEKLLAAGCMAPLVGDFHYNGHILLAKFPECAQALDKYRINPGNVKIKIMIKRALKYGKPVRIGVNWGSLDRELLTEMMEENGARKAPKSDRSILIDALVASALNSAREAQALGLPADRIVLSVKTSDVSCVIEAYEKLAAECDYALHLGLTEAGAGMRGIVASSAALAVLLKKGIGDTIRVSLTPEPGEPRSREVEACKYLLQSLGFRQFAPEVTSCPGCGRTGSDFFQRVAKEVNDYVAARMPEWKRAHVGIEKMKVAVMGCVVNGPGEARHADIALSLPGKTEEPMASVFVKGKLLKTLRGGNVAAEFLEILEEYVTSLRSPDVRRG